MGCSGSREAKSICEARQHSIPLPTENVMFLRDVARACKQGEKSVTTAGAVGTTNGIMFGGHGAYGIPYH